MSTIVDKIARVLSLSPSPSEEFKIQARKILWLLREPTSDMLNDGAECGCKEDILAIWQRMIDGALK